MTHIEEIKIVLDLISTLSGIEISYLVKFLESRHLTGESVIVKLFGIIKKYPAKDSHFYKKKLYGTEASGGYANQVAKLKQAIVEYIVITRQKTVAKTKINPLADTSSEGRLQNMIAYARFCFEQGENELGFEVLKQGAKLAKHHHQYELLCRMLELHLQYLDKSDAKKIEQLLNEFEEAHHIANLDKKASFSLALAARLILLSRGPEKRQSRRKINQIMRELRSDNLYLKVPSIFYKYMAIQMTKAKGKKKYIKLEVLLSSQYQQIEFEFDQSSRYEHLETLYMLARVSFYNKKFSQSNEYLEEMHACLESEALIYRRKFIPRYRIQKAQNLCYLGQLDAAIELIVDLERDKDLKLDSVEKFNSRFNKCFYYMLSGQLKGIKPFVTNACDVNMRTGGDLNEEWMLKWILGELIYHYERGERAGDFEPVLRHLRNAKERFRRLLTTSKHKRAMKFMTIMKKMIDDPEWVQTRAFQIHIRRRFRFRPIEQENIFVIPFYTWLISKATKENYYEVLTKVFKGS